MDQHRSRDGSPSKTGLWKVYRATEGWTGNFARTFAEGSGHLFVTTFDGKIFQFKNDRFQELPSPPCFQNQGYFGHVDPQGRFWAVQAKYFGSWSGTRWSDPVPDTDSETTELVAARRMTAASGVYHHGRLEKFHEGRVVKRLESSEPLDALWSLTEDTDGGVWIASYRLGLTHFLTDGATERSTTSNGLSSEGVRCVLQDTDGDRWVGGSGGGLMRLKRRPILTLSVSQASDLPQGTIRSLSFGNLNTLYLGFYGDGLARGEQQPAGSGFHLETLVPHALIDCVLADRSGRVWAAQSGAGLICLDGSRLTTNDVLATPEKQGLALFEDSRGRIWVSDTKRVSVLDGGHCYNLRQNPAWLWRQSAPSLRPRARSGWALTMVLSINTPTTRFDDSCPPAIPCAAPSSPFTPTPMAPFG